MSKTRLDARGWSTFRPELFLNETGRISRDVGDDYRKLLHDYSPGCDVLELCCGGGALATRLAREGYNVVGLDLSESMLDFFRRRLQVVEETFRCRVRIVHGDMCEFDLHRTFDFIILEDDSFGYLLTQADQIACLRCVHQHVSNGGCFFLSNKTPDIEFSDSQYEYDPISQVKRRPIDWDLPDLRFPRGLPGRPPCSCPRQWWPSATANPRPR